MSLKGGIKAATARSPTRSKSVTAAALQSMGYVSCGLKPTKSIARKLSAVDRCIEILSDSIGKLPNYIIDVNSRKRVPHYLQYLLNIRPNEAMTPFIRKKVIETSRLEGGNGYDWILRNPGTGRVDELIPVPYPLVTPWKDAHGDIWYTVTHPLTGEPMVLPNDDICHYKGATRDGLVGTSVYARADEVIAAGRASQQFEQAFYENGGQPSGVLQTSANLGGYVLDPDGNPIKLPDGSYLTKKDKLRNEWERVHAGPSQSHRTAILDLDLKYTPMSGSNRDAQFVENKEVSVKDIARYFGVPLYKLQEGKQAYGSNEQNAIEYVVSTLHPIVTQYEEEQTYKLLTDSEIKKGLEIRINMMAELKGDTASRGEWYQKASQIGLFSVNDMRALEDMPDVIGGDEYNASLNNVPLSDWKELSRRRAMLSARGGNSENPKGDCI